MELYEVEVHQVNLKSEKKDSLNSSGTVGTASDRYDHIASMGKVKRRLEILQMYVLSFSIRIFVEIGMFLIFQSFHSFHLLD